MRERQISLAATYAVWARQTRRSTTLIGRWRSTLTMRCCSTTSAAHIRLLGKNDEAIACLERAVDKGFGHREWIDHDPDLNGPLMRLTRADSRRLYAERCRMPSNTPLERIREAFSRHLLDRS